MLCFGSHWEPEVACGIEMHDKKMMKGFGCKLLAGKRTGGASGTRAGFVAVLVASMLFLPRGFAAEAFLLRGAAQGTTYHIKFLAEDGTVDRAKLHAEVEQILAEVDRQMSTYRPDSEVSQFNRAPADEWFAVSPAVVEVVAAAQDISQKTDGAMDVTVGPLVRLWHFGPEEPGSRGVRKPRLSPPTDEEIAAARERVGYQKLEVRLEPPALRKLVDGLEVDLSSIASGYTIDRIADLMAKHGLDNFMVELGGEVRAHGHRDDGRFWRVAVERPTDGPREMFTSVPIENAAIATAGDFRKFFEFEGRRYSHVIDPATGRPVTHELASVTVVADTCLEADGWDTPLLVLGVKRGGEVADTNGVRALFLWSENGKTKSSTTKRWGHEVDE